MNRVLIVASLSSDCSAGSNTDRKGRPVNVHDLSASTRCLCFPYVQVFV